jgi:hypothetical protein
MQGKLLSVELVRGDGSLRYFTGYVFSFSRKKSDGSITFYEAKLGPWLKYLSLRNDNYLFHGKTLREQTERSLWCRMIPLHLIDAGCWYITIFRYGTVAAIDKDNVVAVARAINGKENALAERTEFTNRIRKVLL